MNSVTHAMTPSAMPVPPVLDGLVAMTVVIPQDALSHLAVRAEELDMSPEDFASLVIGAWQSNLERKDEYDKTLEALRRSGAVYARCVGCKEFILVQRHIRVGDQCRDCTEVIDSKTIAEAMQTK